MQRWSWSPPFCTGCSRPGAANAGYLDAEGCLFLMGRADEMLICGGVKVYPQAVEQSVLGRLEYVQACAAVGIRDLEYGQAIHLFVVIKPGQPGMTPEAGDRDLTGKVLRRELAASAPKKEAGAKPGTRGDLPQT